MRRDGAEALLHTELAVTNASETQLQLELLGERAIA